MAYLNIVIGLGGTGLEVVNDILTIINRHGLTKGNKLEWFVIDTATLTEHKGKENSFVYKEKEKRYVKVKEWNSAKEVIQKLKKMNPEANFGEIFPEDDYIHTVNSGNAQGSWIIRKIGYLSLLYDLLYGDKDIITRLDKCLTQDNSLGDFNGVNLHIISGMAGGTGSGMFTPLGFILNKYLNKYENDNLKINTYGYLATPDLVARGSRNASEDAQKFNANAFQVLSELNILLNKRSKPWRINLGEERYNFVLNENDRNIFDTVFIIDLYNTENVRWHKKGLDAYKPSFQMIAWSIYFWLNKTLDIQADIGNIVGSGEPGKSFSGIGVQVYEFPYYKILHKLTERYLFPKFFKHYRNFKEKGDIESEKTATEYLLNFHNKLWEKEEYGIQQKKYKNELTQYNNKASIESLRSAKPTIKIKGYQQYFNEFFKEYISKKLNEYLHNYDLEYVIKYISRIYNFTKEEIERIKRTNIETSKERISQLEKLYDSEKKPRKIYNGKTDSYFKKKYELAAALRYSEFLEEIQNALKKIIKIFKDCRAMLDDVAPSLDPEIAADKYFSFPPPNIVFDSEKNNNLDDLVEDLYMDVLNSYKESQTLSSDKETLEYKLYYDIWRKFSFEKFNDLLLERFNDVILNKNKVWNDEFQEETKLQVYNDLFEYMKTFIDSKEKEKKIISKKNNLKNVVNVSEPPNIKYSYPFITMVNELKNKTGKLYILSGENAEIQATEDANAYNVLPDDNVVLFSRIKGQLNWGNLSYDHLKKSYNDMKRDGEFWNKYVDAQIDDMAENS